MHSVSNGYECKMTWEMVVIITHGINLIVETAKRLTDIKDKVIVLTETRHPERFSNSGASFNLGLAIGAINVLKQEIYIAMTGRCYPFDKVNPNEKTGQFVEL